MRTTILLAVMTTRSCQTEYGSHCPAPPDEVMIVIAKHDLLPGTPIAWVDLAFLEMPRISVDRGAIVEPEQVVGRVPVERILAIEAIREERLAPVEAGVGPYALVPEGSVPVEIPRGPSAIEAGNHVDLLVTTDGRSRLLFEGEPVLKIREPESDRSRVVVALSPAEAERVQQALLVGRPMLVLRSDADFPPGR